MKRKKYFLLIFLATFLVTLAVMAPATLLGSMLTRATEGRLVLAEPQGTVWKGRAAPVLKLNGAPPLRLGSVSWDVSPRSLWRGVLMLRVRQIDVHTPTPAEIFLRPREVEFRNFSMRLPAAAMGGLNPMLQAMRLHGRLDVAATRIVIGPGSQVTGSAIAHWEMAGSALSPINPFGSYRFDVKGGGDAIRIDLSTVSGCLQLNGQGQWRAAGLEFQATASATGKSKAVLSEMLHHLGPETAPGVFSFKLGR